MDQGQDSLNLASSSHPSCAAKLHALPVELLAYIFTFCTQVPNESYHHLLHPPWLAITYVCHYWRTITLNHAPLWDSITYGLPLRWIKVFMERSQSMLMIFDLQVLSHNYEDIILLLSDFTRVQSLCLRGHSHTIRPILDLLCSPLPVHSLSLHIRDDWPGVDYNRFTLSDNIFGGNAPIPQVTELSCHTSSSTVSPISQAQSQSHPLNFSISLVRCLRLRILTFVLFPTNGEIQTRTSHLFICRNLRT